MGYLFKLFIDGVMVNSWGVDAWSGLGGEGGVEKEGERDNGERVYRGKMMFGLWKRGFEGDVVGRGARMEGQQYEKKKGWWKRGEKITEEARKEANERRRGSMMFEKRALAFSYVNEAGLWTEGDELGSRSKREEREWDEKRLRHVAALTGKIEVKVYRTKGWRAIDVSGGKGIQRFEKSRIGRLVGSGEERGTEDGFGKAKDGREFRPRSGYASWKSAAELKKEKSTKRQIRVKKASRMKTKMKYKEKKNTPAQTAKILNDAVRIRFVLPPFPNFSEQHMDKS